MEQRNLAVNILPTILRGKGFMIKKSICLQELRRKIYLKVKSDKTYSLLGNYMSSAGTGGVGLGYIR